MSKEKLQVCVSFKHTKEEEELYTYVIGQSDKSVFIKNLIRMHKDGHSVLANKQADIQPIYKDHLEDILKPKIVNGKKTKNKFLA